MAERRKHERANLKRDDIPGAFYIDVGDKSHQFFHVNDVSISGMGIDFQEQVPAGTPIALRYVSDDFRIELNGDVAWCEPQAQAAPFRLGIKFDPTHMDDNVMFFMTLREFVDDFGN